MDEGMVSEHAADITASELAAVDGGLKRLRRYADLAEYVMHAALTAQAAATDEQRQSFVTWCVDRGRELGLGLSTLDSGAVPGTTPSTAPPATDPPETPGPPVTDPVPLSGQPPTRTEP